MRKKCRGQLSSLPELAGVAPREIRVGPVPGHKLVHTDTLQVGTRQRLFAAGLEGADKLR